MSIKQLMEEYEKVSAALNEKIQQEGEKFMEELFQEIFSQHEGLNVIGIVGYTPSFNDGEPCTHSQHIYTGAKLSYGDYIDFADEVGDFEEDFEYDEEDNDHINSKCLTLEEAKDQVEACSEIIERIYDTNFRIVVKLTNDGVKVEHEEYDPGY